MVRNKNLVRGLGLAFLSLLLLVTLSIPVVYAADSTSKTTTTTKKESRTGNGTVQGYAADASIPVGTIVQLDPKDNYKVLAASSDKEQQMYGVVVDPHLLSLTISDTSLKYEVYVATSGTYDVLVSSQGGAIKAGDDLALSSIDGVAMKAGSNTTTFFGRALENFDGKANVVGGTTLKDKAGKEIAKVTFGVVQVAINVQRNPNVKSTKANLPNALQRVGETVAEKPVNPIRIYLSVAIAVMTLIVAIVMLYSGIRSSLIAIGRNPLSKKSIFRGLLEVVLASLVILIIGLFAVYLLLKL
jgi:hypothetical protein